jgi:hypothetical protein
MKGRISEGTQAESLERHLYVTPGYNNSVYEGSRRIDHESLGSSYSWKAVHVHRASSGIGRALHAKCAASEVERRYQT